MCISSGGSYKPSPTPSVVPGTTNVSSGTTTASNAIQARTLESMRKKRGFSSTIRNNSVANGVQAGATAGKTMLGE